MFTGIVFGVCRVSQVQTLPGMVKYGVEIPKESLVGLKIGASVSVDGVCQTVVQIDNQVVWFDAIQETLDKTTLSSYKKGTQVNIERAARFSDEIGGHLLSGHVYGTAKIHQILHSENNRKVTFSCPKAWMKYFLPKGYVAIDGVSLTLVDVDPKGFFSVSLIPETLRQTTLGMKGEGDSVNIEIDSQTQTIVETVERVLASQIR